MDIHSDGDMHVYPLQSCTVSERTKCMMYTDADKAIIVNSNETRALRDYDSRGVMAAASRQLWWLVCSSANNGLAV